MNPASYARRETDTFNDATCYDLLLRSARDVIAREGYQKSTVDDIRRAAGVSRATFYFYFRNKQHLFVQAARSLWDEMYALAERRYPGVDPFERVVQANRDYFETWSKERRFLYELFALSLVDEEVANIFREQQRRFEERTERHLQRLVESGRIPADRNPRLLTLALSGMIETFARRFFTDTDPAWEAEHSLDEAVRVLSEAWYRGVYGEESSAASANAVAVDS
jgi:AcrR family transcriptional regulator